jgi:parvulin-like peptidyl-prolyl isomerase
MKQSKYFTFIFSASLYLCFSASHLLYSEVVSRVVAEVNGEIVTSQELDQILRPLYSKYKRVFSGDDLEKRMEEARKDAITQLIERKLVLQEAKKKNIQVDEKDVESRLSQLRTKFDSEDEFYYALEREGMTVDQLRENLREQLLVRTLTRQEIASSASVSPKEITNYYNDNIKTKFSEPEMVQVGQILIKKGKEKETRDLAYQRIQEVKAKLKQGVPFETVAKEYSEGPYAKEGGDLPFFAKGNLMKEIEQEAFSLDVGQTSDVIESDLGFHILTLKARKKDRVKPLSEAWAEIEEELFQKKLKDVHQKWVDELKKKAHIQIY